MIRYYCSGFDINNAFGHGLGDMFKLELKDTKRIVYIPGGADKMQKVREKYVPAFKNHFENAGIQFDESVIIDPEGSLHACEHDIEGKAFGTVFDQTINWLAVGEEIVEECRDCCFLPDCTPFRKSRCPLNIAACRTQMAIRTERSLVAMLNNSERKANDESIEEC